MPCERRLDAIAVEDFTFNRGAIDDFLRYEFDGQAIARIGVKVLQCADNEAGTFQKLFFGRADAIRIEAEFRPIGKLLTPTHD